MSLAYRITYRFGLTPWEHTQPPRPLADLIEGPAALPPGSAWPDAQCQPILVSACQASARMGQALVPRPVRDNPRRQAPAGIRGRQLAAGAW